MFWIGIGFRSPGATAKHVEVAVVGHEGFIGASLLNGAVSSPMTARATIPGAVWRMLADDFLLALSLHRRRWS